MYWYENDYWLIPTILTLLAMFTRFYRISASKFVVWDEAHFGKFGSHYLKGTFYHDVHPPLAKMLVGLSGLLGGYRGNFEFKSGADYPDTVNYTVMRVFNAAFGVGLIPLAYFTALNLKMSRNAAILAAVFVLFDNALATISRFILLDAMLLFFTALSLYCLTGFHNQRHHPFSFHWWKWLLLTGGSLGLVSSSKWVGFFVVSLAGIYTIEQLYWMLGEKKFNWRRYAYHWTGRIVGLIVLPILIYMICFKIHFFILRRSGSGDATMSSLFQAQLQGSNLKENPLNVAFGSTVTLKSNPRGGGLLHSHPHKYPEGSKQQQITCYSHKDDNNNFIILKPHGEPEIPEEGIEYIREGSIVRLAHVNTGANLHSHAIEAPVTKTDYEVSGYGNRTLGDVFDHWKVEIYDDVQTGKSNKPDQIRSLLTRFRLRHVRLGCLLRSNRDTLPQWGYKQQEVTCDRKNRDDTSNLWNVEYHRHEKLEAAPPSMFKSSFLDDLVHLNVAMAVTNNALVPNRDKIDILSSEPIEWPFLILGLRMCGWDDARVKYYLLGNPFIWWTSTAALLVFPFLLLYYTVRRVRGYQSVDWAPPPPTTKSGPGAGEAVIVADGEWDQFLHTSKMLWGGWALHYFPFFIMGRVTYLHHYFPAVYFAMLFLAFMVDHFGRRLFNGKFHDSMILGFAAMAAAVFMYFSPFTFGFDYPAKELTSRKWLSTWNIHN
ncbi:glycosyltransferase family 39 protein [Dimargaris cristalligena]|uniref:Dolichyl-phosphate-mannose--protein mannosyltransferase n=1 Tax=Dimargaris cristalligena TaxID=215637 RepID=A0A4P9ZV67_9FUNG|nr:glycosyltransferase family 39 protein [Dimargaris cristalligena]|eukprot:RKP36722.1 glycosyltransferase family 39 protein [Dimargaris cristalligena]